MSHDRESSPCWLNTTPQAFKEHVVSRIEPLVTESEKDVEGIGDIDEWLRQRVTQTREKMINEINRHFAFENIIGKIDNRLITAVKSKKRVLDALKTYNRDINREWNHIENGNSKQIGDCFQRVLSANETRKQFINTCCKDPIGQALKNTLESSVKEGVREVISAISNNFLGIANNSESSSNINGSNANVSKAQS